MDKNSINGFITLNDFISELQKLQNDYGNKQIISIGSTSGIFQGMSSPFNIRFTDDFSIYVPAYRKDITHSLYDDLFNIVLTKDDLDKIKESLDVMGDRLADREGYSSGETYWDLKEKLACMVNDSQSKKSLASQILSASERVAVSPSIEKEPAKDFSPEI